MISVLGLLATALLVPFALSRMPVDYFVRDVSPARTSLFVRVLKNVFGIVLVVLGVAMLVLPGQGLLTIVLGLGLVDFPGRRRSSAGSSAVPAFSKPSTSSGIGCIASRSSRHLARETLRAR